MGLFVAFFSEDQYTSTTTLVPQTSGGVRVSGNLGGLAALAGINLGSMSNSELSPVLYPKIFNSVSYKKKLLDAKLEFEKIDAPVSFRQYYTDYYQPSVLSLVYKYTFGLPNILFKNKEKNIEGTSNILNYSIEVLSTTDRQLLEKIDQKLSITLNEKEGYITIESTMPEAKAAAQLANAAKQKLQQTIIEMHIEKAKTQLEFLESRYTEKQNEFEKAQISLANYRDRNLFSNTARGSTELERLQSEYDLAFNVYNQLAQQVESQRLQVKQDTPVFTVIQSPVVPNQKAGLGKFRIILVCLFTGLFFSLVFLFGYEWFYLSFKRNNI
ncbi:Wzz/FepE/Etk N-terminal domain-containing protein [Croceiramulus getboli]|nr:capsule biosynthesis protein [Flavobacteriaceae bacterium YJPT1-3]